MSLFIKTDVDIPFVVDSGFAIGDVADMTVRLEQGEFSLTKTLGAGIEVDGSQFVLSIANNEITATGQYVLYARITDTGGKQRGITLSPSSLSFNKFPIQP